MNKLSVVVLAFLFAVGLTACEKGPAEKAGERMDDAAEDAGDRIEDATDNAGNALEDAGDRVEDKLDH